MNPNLPSHKAHRQDTPAFVLLVVALFGGLCLTAQNAGATASSNTGNDGDVCRDLVIVAVSLQNAAGDVVQCVHAPAKVATAASTWTLSSMLSSPVLSGASPTLTLTTSGLAGCSAGTASTFGTSASASANPETSSVWVITMSASECRGYVEGKVTTGGVTIYDAAVAFNVESDDQTRTVDNTGALTVHQDALSGTVTVHQDPLSGTISVHQDALSGSVNVVNSGALNVDALDRQCAASPYGASCTPAPTFGNLTLSGLNLTANTSTTLCSTPALDADAHACTIRLENQPNGNNTGLALLPKFGDWQPALVASLILAWVLYAYLTIRVPDEIVRVLLGLAGLAWLAVPQAIETTWALATLQLALITWTMATWASGRNRGRST